MTERRLIVAGSRDLTEKHIGVVFDACNRWVDQYGVPTHLLNGRCKGADRLGFIWAAHYRDEPIEIVTFEADWAALGKKAGPLRNQDMVDLADGLVVVRYPDSRGSADVLRRAQRKGIPIVDVVL